MNRLVFDIETVGTDFNALDEHSQEYLTKGKETEEELKMVKEGMGFSPLTGQIVAIGALNPDTGKGAVYYQSPGADAAEKEQEDVRMVSVPTEKELLEKFWEAAAHYRQFVTFNGRAFDAPFIIVRSAVNHVKPTRNLMPYRYGDDHIDLYDRLGFFNAVRRNMNLHMWCQALGIASPKTHGVTGYDVASLFRDGRYGDIAKYCMDDVYATAELFRYWDEYVNIK
ncbi:MAG TPA: ribonuclease H-like domain-containing protein [Candidatus Paceibacterota bacterium]|nr:ribonuclease H-like domain-containing protein [Candidatus Paceibacterota bacterium]